MTKLFRTKVCGIKTTADLCNAINVGVEAIGLNFVPESPRFVTPNAAAELLATRSVQEAISSSPRHAPAFVGVLVNPTPAYVRQILRTVPLQYIQLHGEEVADEWRDFGDAPLIKAVRWSGDTDQCKYLTRWHQMLGGRLAAFLVDAPATDVRGGSGMKADWSTLVPRPAVLAGKPLVLAGGLNPDNVQQAIETVQPNAVDTASGVESAPGNKDVNRMRSFVQNSHRAWSSMG